MILGDPLGGFLGAGGASNWDDYEQAIRQWVIEASGLNTTKVIRAEQNGPRPATPFAEVRVGDAIAVGAADAVERYYDPFADPGEEVTLVVRGLRELEVTVRVFTDASVGAESARALLEKTRTALGLDTFRDILQDAGVTVFDRGVVQHLPGVLDTRWEGRATLTVRAYVEDTVSETTGYIDSVQVTDQSVDPDDTYTLTP